MKENLVKIDIDDRTFKKIKLTTSTITTTNNLRNIHLPLLLLRVNKQYSMEQYIYPTPSATSRMWHKVNLYVK